MFWKLRFLTIGADFMIVPALTHYVNWYQISFTGERCLDDDTYMKDLYQLNPNAEWVIKSKPQ